MAKLIDLTARVVEIPHVAAEARVSHVLTITHVYHVPSTSWVGSNNKQALAERCVTICSNSHSATRSS